MHSQQQFGNYLINSDTFVLQPIHADFKTTTRVIERHTEFSLPKKPIQIVRKTCELYGSSLKTRTLTARRALGNRHKTPIVVAHAFDTPYIFLPTMSPASDDNMWISYHAITDFKEESSGCSIHLENGRIVKVNVSTPTMWRQFAFAALLERDFEKKQFMLQRPRMVVAQHGSFTYPVAGDTE
ncbi:competence protein ComK [Sporosarcina trichiuri]|uniref:competence protein ComK n=1 Tax=Sporosarcina trichiuri TaxID=3056445 RepID=UPI0025B40D5F|nr:competence protein ComK [Sporosarcina sp. 0.2-SM1T-5]WJY26156.1 competence protein ComK [Sporosarcina sp. 0.2-SM1T-5]